MLAKDNIIQYDINKNIIIEDENTVRNNKNIRGNDLATDLFLSFRDDILFRKLESAHLENLIITDEMRSQLKKNKTYSPDEVEKMTGINAGTLRGWINGNVNKFLPLYIRSIKDGHHHKLNCKAIFRVRLIYLAQQYLNYTINYIAQLSTGIIIDNNEYILPSEEIEKLKENQKEQKKEMEHMKQIILSIAKQNKFLFKAHNDAFIFENGKYRLKKDAIPLLDDPKERDKLIVLKMRKMIKLNKAIYEANTRTSFWNRFFGKKHPDFKQIIKSIEDEELNSMIDNL